MPRQNHRFVGSHFCAALLVPILGLAAASNRGANGADGWQAVTGKMMTPWAKTVAPDSAWQEYPRPQFERTNWTNLNGLWSYCVTEEATPPDGWLGKILVPFCPESSLSGVGRLIEPNEYLWYQRELPPRDGDKRTLLHFEAVDYDAIVWVNGKEVGQHRGGHTPFSFDITDQLEETNNKLLVRIQDATEAFQLHGKQNLVPKGIWYTRVTGIWQTVWLESVSESYLADVDYECNLDGTLRITPRVVSEDASSLKFRARVLLDGQPAGRASGAADQTLVIKVDVPKLWSPESPTLYQVELQLLDTNNAVIDNVKSYTAFREFGKVKDDAGHWRFTLNGKPYFHWGPLDQGWWPDGLLTPPSDEAMKSDIVFLKEAGFNMIRKHIKVEPRRYYYHCDKLGMLMWQDQVSNGTGQKRGEKGTSPAWTRLQPNPVDAEWPEEAHQQYLVEYERMVNHLRDAVCIASWVPYNEAWGQHRTMEVGKFATELDRTRAINIASGGNFWPIGDVADEHKYPDPGFPLDDVRFHSFVKVVGEFGGHGWPVEDHLWVKTDKNWGYGGLPKTMDEWKDRYAKSIRMLSDLKKQGIAAGVYTQTTDVEVEVNGLRTYDRVDKVDPAWLKEQAKVLFE